MRSLRFLHPTTRHVQLCNSWLLNSHRLFNAKSLEEQQVGIHDLVSISNSSFHAYHALVLVTAGNSTSVVARGQVY